MSKSANKCDAASLTEALWDTLHKVKDGDMQPAVGDTVAAQAREILRCKRVQLQVAKLASQSISSDLVDFANP